MGENLALVGIGTVTGYVVNAVTTTPWCLTLVLALCTGILLGFGKGIGAELVKQIKKKFSKNVTVK